MPVLPHSSLNRTLHGICGLGFISLWSKPRTPFRTG